MPLSLGYHLNSNIIIINSLFGKQYDSYRRIWFDAITIDRQQKLSLESGACIS